MGHGRTFMRRSTCSMAMSDSGFFFVFGKSRFVPSTRGSERKRSRAAFDSGTLCSIAPFMCSAGQVQTAPGRLNSSQVARRTSCERAAARIASSNARAAIPCCWRSSTIKGGMPSIGKASWCFTLLTFDGMGSSLSKWPFQRAGYSPSRSAAPSPSQAQPQCARVPEWQSLSSQSRWAAAHPRCDARLRRPPGETRSSGGRTSSACWSTG